MHSEHIGIEHYEWVRRGEMTPGELLRRLYQHVLDRCPGCRREWEALAAGQHAGFWQLLVGGVSELPLDLIAPPLPAGRPQRPSRYDSAFGASAKKLTAAARSRACSTRRWAKAGER